MNFVSYAQNFEDVLLWRALGYIENGSYLDIGAQDPGLDSVSLAFYERGWRGIHVEPTPHYAEKLRTARPEETVIQAAVGSGAGLLTLFEIPDTGLSTGIAEIARMHSDAGLPGQSISVPQVSLSSIFEQFAERQIHWMKVDVEGMEESALHSWAHHPARPWIVLIEATLPNSRSQTHQEWQHELFDRGYSEVLFDGLNRWYLASDQLQHRDMLSGPPCYFDAFQITATHFSAKHMRELSERAMEHAAGEFSRSKEQIRAEAAATLSDLETRLNSQIADLHDERDRHARGHVEQLGLLRAERDDWRRRHDALQFELVKLMRATTEERRLASEAEQHRVNLAAAERDEQMQRIEDLRQRVKDSQQQLNASREETGQAQATAAHYATRLRQADALIASALAKPAGRWQRLGRVLGFVGPDPLRQILLGWAEANNSTLEEGNMTLATASGHRNPYFRADSLKELLEWDDVDFVRCAYVTILGRQPDPSGEGHFTDRLRLGDSKLAILWNLRRSNEGQNHDPGIAGLDRALGREARRRNRYFGWLARAFLRGEGTSRHDRRFRQLRNMLAVISVQQGRQSEAIAANQKIAGEMMASLERISNHLAELADQVSNSQKGGQEDVGESQNQLVPRGTDLSVRVTDSFDLSSRERAILGSIKLAGY